MHVLQTLYVKKQAMQNGFDVGLILTITVIGCKGFTLHALGDN